MSEHGVPSSVLVGDDHMQVRSGLVKLLGGGNEALVWTRVEFRTRHVAFAHEDGGKQWWEVTQAQVGEEVGLSVEAAKGALRRLVERGFLLAEQHHLPMQTMSYSPVILQSVESPIGTVPIGGMVPSNRADDRLQEVESPIAPLFEEREEESQEAPVVPVVISPDDLFAMAWANWPKKTEKKLSRERFVRALKKRPTLADDVTRFGLAYLTTTEVQFVPALAVWIGRERWDEPLPVGRAPRTVSPTDRALATLALARQPDEQRSVSA